MSLPKYAMNQASFPAMYERELVGRLFKPFAEITLDKIGVAPGDRLLDIACGTGVVARAARERIGPSATIVAVDISSDMLEIARNIEPSVDWREGDAAALPVGSNEQFDVVICHQGLQFVADKGAAAAEMRRVLRRGGRSAVAAWCSDDEIPFFRDLRLVAERHLGPISDQRYGFGDAAALEDLLGGAGLTGVRVTRATHTVRMDNGATLVRMNAMALVGMSSGGVTLDEGERQRMLERIVQESQPVLDAFSSRGVTAFDIATNLATANG